MISCCIHVNTHASAPCCAKTAPKISSFTSFLVVTVLLAVIGPCLGGFIMLQPQCTVTIKSPAPDDVLALRNGTTYHLVAHADFAKHGNGTIPSVAALCMLIEAAHYPFYRISCVNISTSGAVAELQDMNIDLELSAQDGEGYYSILLYVMTNLTAPAAETIMTMMLKGNGDLTVDGCATKTHFTVIEYRTSPWWAEFVGRDALAYTGLEKSVEEAKEARQSHLATVGQVARDGNWFTPEGWIDLYMTQPPLSYRKVPKLIGPVLYGAAEEAKSEAETKTETIDNYTRFNETNLAPFVAVFSGNKTKQLVCENIEKFIASTSALDIALTVLLCVYDGSDWSDVRWVREEIPHVTVIVVSVLRQMKWWFAKRFITPTLVNSGTYSHVVILDSDVQLPSHLFEFVDFLATLRRYGVMIGQPAHTLTSHNTFILLGLPEDRELFLQRLKDEAQDIDTQLRQDPTRMLRRTDLIGRNVSRIPDNGSYVPGKREIEGRWMTFVESGPLIVFDTQVWPCIWNLLQTDLVSGYGNDVLWVRACAPWNTAVIDSHQLHHLNLREASAASSNMVSRMVAESFILLRRMTRDPRWIAGDMHAQLPLQLIPFTPGSRHVYVPPPAS